MDFGIGNMVHDMFTLGVPVWERIIRAVLVYAFQRGGTAEARPRSAPTRRSVR